MKKTLKISTRKTKINKDKQKSKDRVKMYGGLLNKVLYYVGCN